MSTYYYMVCDEHRSYCDAISRTSDNGVCWLDDAPELLPQFLFDHIRCVLRLISEHEQDLVDYPREGDPYLHFASRIGVHNVPVD